LYRVIAAPVLGSVEPLPSNDTELPTAAAAGETVNAAVGDPVTPELTAANALRRPWPSAGGANVPTWTALEVRSWSI
jgi:hypothetical protein